MYLLVCVLQADVVRNVKFTSVQIIHFFKDMYDV